MVGKFNKDVVLMIRFIDTVNVCLGEHVFNIT